MFVTFVSPGSPRKSPRLTASEMGGSRPAAHARAVVAPERGIARPVDQCEFELRSPGEVGAVDGQLPLWLRIAGACADAGKTANDRPAAKTHLQFSPKKCVARNVGLQYIVL